MNQAAFIVLAFTAGVMGLAAYLKDSGVLLALAFIPALLQDMPFGLAAAKIQADAEAANQEEEEDEAVPMGFTQDVKSRK